MHERNFVLIPILEIAGDFIHPELKLSMKELYERSKDPLKVKIYQS
jgi:2-amino-4-hydroxy-6-hydroxymethyldihydropteridine diphosphokinase